MLLGAFIKFKSSEIIKTVIENSQNLIIEGCYIPFDWSDYFNDKYLSQIKYYCLVMTENYITHHFDDILKYSDIIESRADNEALNIRDVIDDNLYMLKMCIEHKLNYILIDNEYNFDIDLD